MVVERGMVCGAIEHSIENVGVVDLQVSGGLDAHGVVDKSLIPSNRLLALGHASRRVRCARMACGSVSQQTQIAYRLAQW